MKYEHLYMDCVEARRSDMNTAGETLSRRIPGYSVRGYNSDNARSGCLIAI